MDNILELIISKTNQARSLNILNIFLAVILTLIGTISIFSLLLCLNQVLSINHFICLILTIPLSQIYSVIVNSLLHNIDIKIKNILIEIEQLEEKYENEIKFEKGKNIKSIEIRFDGLSRKNKIKLLRFIEDSLVCKDEALTKIQEESEPDASYELYVKNQFADNSGYSRKRKVDKAK